MPVITWNEADYGTGVDFADDEHKILFDMLNALHDAAPSGDRSLIGEKLDTLIGYVAEHFAHEEREMEARNYAGLAAHKVEHGKLVAAAVDIQTKFKGGDSNVSQETTQFIKGWLDTHIPNVDRLYESTLNS